MILYIAEKPSLARALVEALPLPHHKKNGYIMVNNGDCVTWCIGHLLEQATPDQYEPRYARWNKQDLPIVPQIWKWTPKSDTQTQLKVVLQLIAQADEIVHVGDPDREGQLLVDEVLHYSQIPTVKLQQAKRCLISDLNRNAVTKALTQLRSNRDFVALSTSALARARADWLYGINMTRLCTLKGRDTGYQGVLSVGRVQTPLLGLIVRREQEIEQFQPKDYYEIVVDTRTDGAQTIQAKWVPGKESELYQDDQGRVLDKTHAEMVLQCVTGETGKILSVSEKQRQHAPPLPVNLSFLQIEMAKKHGVTAQQVLTSCQNLYERYKLITYPRSDNRYLSLEQYQQRQAVLKTLKQNLPDWNDALDHADLALRSKAWDDKKIEAHHAIIPTLRNYNLSQLPLLEQQIYQMVSCYYLAQFYPPYQFIEQQIEIAIKAFNFKSKEIKVQDLGWKKLFASQYEARSSEKVSLMGKVSKGESVTVLQAELQAKQTTAPRHFTDATLLSAMTGISRFVADPIIKKVLLDTDGLGTEATRAGIIELLFKRDYLYRQGKEIKATAVGRSLIENLPDTATTPDMTALWESQLDKMAKKQLPYRAFMDELVGSLQHVLHLLAQKPFRLAQQPNKPAKRTRSR